MAFIILQTYFHKARKKRLLDYRVGVRSKSLKVICQ